MFKILCVIEAARVIMILWTGITVAKGFWDKCYQSAWLKASLIAGYNFCLGVVSIPLLRAYYSSIGSHVDWLNLLVDLSITLLIVVVCLAAFFRLARD